MNGYFGEVLKLSKGDSLLVDDDHIDLICQTGIALENDKPCSAHKLQNMRGSCLRMECKGVVQADQRKFGFIVDHREDECSVLKACFLSPRVSAIRNAKIPSESGRRVLFWPPLTVTLVARVRCSHNCMNRDSHHSSRHSNQGDARYYTKY